MKAMFLGGPKSGQRVPEDLVGKRVIEVTVPAKIMTITRSLDPDLSLPRTVLYYQSPMFTNGVDREGNHTKGARFYYVADGLSREPEAIFDFLETCVAAVGTSLNI